ncbi:hypothetical protein ZWY2020_026769 [Hordeum vulgare]|nr:hypothetical protein ZWY2020_026769 [Hordeum vulgare]
MGKERRWKPRDGKAPATCLRSSLALASARPLPLRCQGAWARARRRLTRLPSLFFPSCPCAPVCGYACSAPSLSLASSRGLAVDWRRGCRWAAVHGAPHAEQASSASACVQYAVVVWSARGDQAMEDLRGCGEAEAPASATAAKRLRHRVQDLTRGASAQDISIISVQRAVTALHMHTWRG